MYIDANGFKWFKGNLHTHTTRTDGRHTPEQAVREYAENGYDFMALTDHWQLSDEGENFGVNGIFTLSGIELDRTINVRDGVFHIVGVGLDSIPQTNPRNGENPCSAQELIDAINDAGGAAILAHPAWSLDTPESIMRLKGLCAAEIYNSVSGTPWNARPYSGQISDMLSMQGYFLNLVSSDDAHFYEGDQCLSYIMLKTDILDRSHILAALRAGDFYATQAPRFSHKIEDDVLTITTTPAAEVIFFSDTVFTSDRVTRGNGITEAKYNIKKSDTFVRYEIRDAAGKCGWSSPIKIRGI